MRRLRFQCLWWSQRQCWQWRRQLRQQRRWCGAGGGDGGSGGGVGSGSFGFGSGGFPAFALADCGTAEATTHTACTVASSFNASSLCTPLAQIVGPLCSLLGLLECARQGRACSHGCCLAAVRVLVELLAQHAGIAAARLLGLGHGQSNLLGQGWHSGWCH